MTSLVDHLMRDRFESERQSRVAALRSSNQLGSDVRVTRDHRLRALVAHARNHSPWHRDRLADVDIETLRGDDLAALPVMTKADVMANWNEIVTDPELTLEDATSHLSRVVAEGPGFWRGNYLVFVTAGSSGTRGVFPWHWRDYLEAGLSAGRLTTLLAGPPEGRDEHARAVEDPSIRFAGVWANSPLHGTVTSGWLQQAFAGVRTEGRSAASPIDELVAWLNTFQPTQLTGYASALERLAHEAASGRLRITPSSVCAMSEPVPDRLRSLVEEQWGVGLMNLYGAIECTTIACSAPGQRLLWPVEDLVIVEPVDDRHRSVPSGVAGSRLLITCLVNRTMPLLRYELSDRVAIVPSPSGDPDDGWCLTPPEGRTDARFSWNGSRELHPVVVWTAMYEHPGVLEYQVRQTLDGLDVDVCLTEPEDLEVLRRRLVDELVRVGVHSPVVRIDAVTKIARLDDSAKLRHFVPLPRAGRS